MGLSPKHASTVPLVLNVQPGYITPRFHFVFDDWFSTIATAFHQLPDFNSPLWAQLFGDSICKFPSNEDEDTSEISTTPHSDSVATAMDHTITPLPTTSFPITPHPPSSTPFPTHPDTRHSAPMSSTRAMQLKNEPSSPKVDSIASADSTLSATTPPRTLFPLPSPVPPSSSPAPTPQTREHLAHAPVTLQPTPSPAVTAQAPSPAPAPSIVHQPRRSTRQWIAPTRLGYDGNQGLWE